MKTAYLIAAAAVGAILWRRGQAIEKAKSNIQEAAITDGTNWVTDWWGRLNGGTDLRSYSNPNLDNAIIADPGKVGQSALRINPNWNGSLQ